MSMLDDCEAVVLEAGTQVLRAMPLAQACARAGVAPPSTASALPAATAAMRAAGAAAVVVASVPQAAGAGLHWLDAAHGRGWVHSDATPAFVPAWSAMLARGHVPADAALLAWPALPRLTWDSEPVAPRRPASTRHAPLGLYAIVDTTAQLARVLEAGVRTVQLRIKRPADADAAWDAALRATLRDGLARAAGHGATLFVNDHWRLAAELGAAAVHLGQEDLLALGAAGRQALQDSGVALGISSHAVWELARALSLAPRYVACGPVWPTTTKDMPWRPQGLDNLGWWCGTADVPVVAIGGILTADQVRQAARCGADGVCVLRGLGEDPRRVVPGLQAAFEQGRAEAAATRVPEAPHPTLEARA